MYVWGVVGCIWRIVSNHDRLHGLSYPTARHTQAFIDPILSGARQTKGALRVVFNARSTRLLLDDENGGTRVVREWLLLWQESVPWKGNGHAISFDAMYVYHKHTHTDRRGVPRHLQAQQPSRKEDPAPRPGRRDRRGDRLRRRDRDAQAPASLRDRGPCAAGVRGWVGCFVLFVFSEVR